MFRFLFLSFILFSFKAHSTLLPDSFVTSGRIKDYQIGDEWGKKPVTEKVLENASKEFHRAAMATAYLPVGGTGFYLGKFQGSHVLATNHHVCPVARDCVGEHAQFPLLGKSLLMTRLFVSLPDIDLALIEIKVQPKDEFLLSKIGRNFAFNKSILKGQELLTIGFGIGGNPRNLMMANQDSDCKVFSKNYEYRHLADPDEFNPADYRAWSFAHACDISHGDSGSAMVDRKTGDVLGIVWTGKIPKSPEVQASSNLIKIFNSPLGSEIWKELSYAVPAAKIKHILIEVAQDSQTTPETKHLLKALVR
jgi:hypothetical protein